MSVFGDIVDTPWWRSLVALDSGKIVVRKYGNQWMLMIKGFNEPVVTPTFEVARFTAAWCVDMGRRGWAIPKSLDIR